MMGISGVGVETVLGQFIYTLEGTCHERCRDQKGDKEDNSREPEFGSHGREYGADDCREKEGLGDRVQFHAD